LNVKALRGVREEEHGRPCRHDHIGRLRGMSELGVRRSSLPTMRAQQRPGRLLPVLLLGILGSVSYLYSSAVAPALRSDQARVRLLRGHTDAISSVVFSPDGHLIASGSADRTARLWNAHTGQLVRVLAEHRGAVLSVDICSAGRFLVSGSGNTDCSIRLWDLQTGRCLRTLRGDFPFIRVCFQPTTLAGGSTRQWNAKQATASGQLPLLAALSSDRTERRIQLWKLDGRGKTGYLKGHTDWVCDVDFSPDGRTLASGSFDKRVRLWNISTRRTRRVLFSKRAVKHRGWAVPQGYTVAAVRFSPDGRHLAAAGPESLSIRIWNPKTGRALRVMTEPDFVPDGIGHVPCLAFRSDGRHLASGSSLGVIWLWDVMTGQTFGKLEGHQGHVYSVAFSPDGRLLASGGGDGVVRLWELPDT
jgi:WD40 repeat protein